MKLSHQDGFATVYLEKREILEGLLQYTRWCKYKHHILL